MDGMERSTGKCGFFETTELDLELDKTERKGEKEGKKKREMQFMPALLSMESADKVLRKMVKYASKMLETVDNFTRTQKTIT